MNKKDFIQLTLDLYDLTGYFPNKEPLRYKIRGVADDVLSDLLLLISNPGPSLKDKKKIKSELADKIQVLENLFEVAKPQDWVSPDDISEMKKEYIRIKDALELAKTAEKQSEQRQTKQKPAEETPEEKQQQKKVNKDVSERQRKVMKQLEKKGPSQVSDLMEDFSEISRRTLIRDLNYLTDEGLIKRTGKGPSVFYSLN